MNPNVGKWQDGTGNDVLDGKHVASLQSFWVIEVVVMQIHTNKMLENSFLGRDIDLWDLAGC